jgi:hypothetical protein
MSHLLLHPEDTSGVDSERDSKVACHASLIACGECGFEGIELIAHSMSWCASGVYGDEVVSTFGVEQTHRLGKLALLLEKISSLFAQ